MIENLLVKTEKYIVRIAEGYPIHPICNRSSNWWLLVADPDYSSPFGDLRHVGDLASSSALIHFYLLRTRNIVKRLLPVYLSCLRFAVTRHEPSPLLTTCYWSEGSLGLYRLLLLLVFFSIRPCWQSVTDSYFEYPFSSPVRTFGKK